MVILMILMKNSFSFNVKKKTFLKTFLLCKIFHSLDYPYTVEYKQVLLISLSTSYSDHQSILLCKPFPFLGFLDFLDFLDCLGEKNLKSRRKFSTLGENSQHRRKFSAPGENSQLLGKTLNFSGRFSTLGKILNSGENF